MWDPYPDIPWSSWRGGLCERTGPSLYGVAGLSRRISQKEDTPGHFGEFSCSSSSSVLSTWPPSTPAGVWRVLSPNRKQHLGESAHVGVGLRPQASTVECACLTSEGPKATGTKESANQGRPLSHTHSPEESECLNLWVWRPLESWAGGCPTADRDREELG